MSEIAKLSITDKIKTFEDALKLKGLSMSYFKKYCGKRSYNIAMEKLVIIASALNEEWTPDWKNNIQYKWYPYFKMAAPFSFSYTGCACANSLVGSRLCFRSEELAEYAGRQFDAIYKEFYA